MMMTTSSAPPKAMVPLLQTRWRRPHRTRKKASSRPATEHRPLCRPISLARRAMTRSSAARARLQRRPRARRRSQPPRRAPRHPPTSSLEMTRTTFLVERPSVCWQVSRSHKVFPPSKNLSSVEKKVMRQRNKKEDEEPTSQLLVEQENKKRWRNWWIRGALTIVMLSAFAMLVAMGQVALTFVIIVLQLKCFHEIIRIGHVQYKEKDLPWFRTINWLFVLTANYFFYGEGLTHFYKSYLDPDTVHYLVRYHRFISFMLYLGGFCTFVLNLKKDHYKFQFRQFAWTHLACLIIVSQSHMIIRNMYYGLVWLILPATIIVCNDCMAYIFGFFFGRTPLIKISPKKTWEGFIGAFFSTLVWAVVFGIFISQYDYFTCPVENFTFFPDTPTCIRNPLFEWTSYPIPPGFSSMLHAVGVTRTSVTLLPLANHALVLAVFGSLIAPFGGFFASGLKRAYNIKDFDDLIPGHGGVMDRFDCFLFMGTFTYLYYNAFLWRHDLNNLLLVALSLDVPEQQELYQSLQASLAARDALP
eukprot:m.198291 g.198291  ORF g.198291 m.198291 type:complete len:529 (-) comp21876_c1_seq1:46-1632(-)